MPVWVVAAGWTAFDVNGAVLAVGQFWVCPPQPVTNTAPTTTGTSFSEMVAPGTALFALLKADAEANPAVTDYLPLNTDGQRLGQPTLIQFGLPNTGPPNTSAPQNTVPADTLDLLELQNLVPALASDVMTTTHGGSAQGLGLGIPLLTFQVLQVTTSDAQPPNPFVNCSAYGGGPTLVTQIIPTPVPITLGGTGQVTAPLALAALGGAASGANNDITALNALSTPIPVNEGGTGATTAVGARTALGLGSLSLQAVPAAGLVKSDGTTISSVADPLPLADGGTAATSAAAARTSLGLGNVATLNIPLTVAQGGTGVATLTGIPLASGTSAFTAATHNVDFTSPADAQNMAATWATDTGTATAYAIAASPAIAAYQAGQWFSYVAVNANTGGATLNVNAKGAKTIVKWGGQSALVFGDIVAGQLVTVFFDGTNFQLAQPPSNFEVAGGRPLLTNGKWIRVAATNLIIGNTDIYTVPAGRRAAVFGYAVMNPSAGAITFIPEFKVSGTYFAPAANGLAGVGAGVSNAQSTTVMPILEAGEILAVNAATTAGGQIWFEVFEFDNTSGLKSSKLLSLASGNNTVYTVPANKSAVVLTGNVETVTGSGTGGVTGELQYFNSSGGNRTIRWHFVNSGGSVTTGIGGNQVVAAVAITTGSLNSAIAHASLGAGDFVAINTDANTATQVAWVTVYEN